MRTYAVEKLKTLVSELEALADRRDILLRQMQDVLNEGERQGFDRNGLIQMLEVRLGNRGAAMLKNRNALCYLHALGDLREMSTDQGAENTRGVVKNEAA